MPRVDDEEIGMLWNNGEGAAIGDIIGVELPPEMTITQNEDGTVTIEWTGDGMLQEATDVNGPWTDLPDETSPYVVTPIDVIKVFRVVK